MNLYHIWKTIVNFKIPLSDNKQDQLIHNLHNREKNIKVEYISLSTELHLTVNDIFTTWNC